MKSERRKVALIFAGFPVLTTWATFQWYALNQPFRISSSSFNAPFLLPNAFQGDPYLLTLPDGHILSKLLKKTIKAYKNADLSTVLTRFDDSFSRIKQEDKLIDYWVALEAMFFSLIPKEFVSTMGDTVASNIAYYVGKEEAERRSIYASIIASHKLRGFLIHGQRGTSSGDLNLVVRKTGELLRQALRKRIEE